MSYLGRSGKLSLKAQEKVSFLATAGQTSKTGLSYVPSFVEVYVNGVLLTDNSDYTATNGNSITFTVALLLNDEVTVISLKTFTVADHYSKTEADTLLAAKSPIASPSFTGSVGIGTASPSRTLEVYSSQPAIKLNNGTNAFTIGTGAFIDGSNSLVIYDEGVGERMRLNSLGNVGINTSIPLEKLHIDGGDINISRTANLQTRSIKFGSHVPATISAEIRVTQPISGNEAGNIGFWTRPTDADGGGSVTERMLITSDGRGLSDFTAKAWLQIYQTGTQGIRDSHNVSSITDSGVGVTQINFANNLANADYAAVASHTIQSSVTNISDNVTNHAVGNFTIHHRENGSLIDTSRHAAIVFGS